MSSNIQNTESNFLFKGQKQEFLDWLESLRISKYWLDTMTHEESYALCKEINQVLKKFKDLELVEKEKLFSLIEINSFLQEIYAKLHISYLNSKIPLPKNQQKTVDLIIDTYMELARAYYGIMLTNKTAEDNLSEQFLGLTACKGLQGLGIVFLTAAEIYTDAPKKFWLLCYELFNLSEEYNLIDLKIKIDNSIYSVAVLFKQIIVFYIIDKNQLSAKENSDVFQVLLRGVNYIQNYALGIIDMNLDSEVFGFWLQHDEAPTTQINNGLNSTEFIKYIEKYEVIKMIQFLLREAKEPSERNLVNPEVFSRILTTLEHQKHKRQRRISKQYNCSAVVGITSLIEFLQDKEGKKEATTPVKKVNESMDDLESFQLILDWDCEKEFNDDNYMVENLHIVDSSMNGYGVCWDDTSIGKLQIGEVIGVIPDFNSTSKKIEIGLIRRIKIIDNHVIFGIQLIGLESTLIYIERENKKTENEWVIFLFGSPNYDVGILVHKERDYQMGENFFVLTNDKRIPCQLGELLNSTPLVEHITLCY
jgi:hypothetical protein